MPAVAKIILEIDQEGVVTGVAQVEGALQKIGTRGNVVMTGLANDQRRAQQASQLLSRTLGVQVPRALDNVIARSKLVGPLLSAAFNAAVVVGLGAVLIALIPKIQNAADALGGFTQGLKDIEEAARKANEELFKTFSLPASGRRFLEMTNAEIRALEQKRARLEENIRLGQEGFVTPAESARALKALGELGKVDVELTALNERRIDILKQLGELGKEAALKEAEGLKKAREEARKAAEAMKKLAEANRQFWFEAGMKAGETLQKQTADFLIYARAAGLSAEGIARLATVMRVELEPSASIASDVLKQQTARLEALRKAVETARSIEEQAAIDRARLEGRTMDAIILEEKRRTRETIDELEKIGLAEEDLKDVRIALETQTKVKIAEENKRRLEEMAGHWDSFVDRVIFGAESWKDFFKGMLREMLATFLKFIGRMIIAWITGLEKMKDIWEAFKKSLPGGGGGGAGTIIFNFLAGFQHGGLVDDAFRAMRAVHSGDGRLLAMLHQGEAVLNPGAVRLLGAGRIERLNATGRQTGMSGPLASFQGGGFVGGHTGVSAPPTVNINFGPGSIISPASDPRRVAAEVIRAIRRRARDQGSRLPI